MNTGSRLSPEAIHVHVVRTSLDAGWGVFGRCRGLSLAYGGVFALIGSALIWGAQRFGLSAMTIPLFGGFLLVGPVAMAGLIGVSEAAGRERQPSTDDILETIARAPRGLWALSLFCLLMFLIWLTDAGTLFSFMVGERSAGLSAVLPRDPDSMRFQASAALTGFIFANVVFAVTVHAVPLLVSGRAGLVGAVTASVRAVFRSPVAHGLWALLLGAGVFSSLLMPPLLALTLPLLAYTGHAFHVAVFPRCGD